MGLLLRPRGPARTEVGEKKERSAEGEGPLGTGGRGGGGTRGLNRNQDGPDRHQAGNLVRNIVCPCCLLLVSCCISWKPGEFEEPANSLHHLLRLCRTAGLLPCCLGARGPTSWKAQVVPRLGRGVRGDYSWEVRASAGLRLGPRPLDFSSNNANTEMK